MSIFKRLFQKLTQKPPPPFAVGDLLEWSVPDSIDILLKEEGGDLFLHVGDVQSVMFIKEHETKKDAYRKLFLVCLVTFKDRNIKTYNLSRGFFENSR
jgi:hypothetical protein